MRNLLIGAGVMTVGFAVYILWDDHVQEVEQEAFAAEKRAEFIERRRAYARKKSVAAATEDGAGQEPFMGDAPEADAPAYEPERS